jgi:ABC-type phosphate transport system auxiliary subunit
MLTVAMTLLDYISLENTSASIFRREFLTMARHSDIRRAAVNYCENIEDASSRLRVFASLNNYTDVDVITTLMNSLQQMSAVNISAAIDRAENSMLVIKTLLDVLKNQKKLRDAEMKVSMIPLSLDCSSFVEFNEFIYID